MKKRLLMFLILGQLLQIFFAGCSSTQKIEKELIYAMVYDLENNPVQDMEFFLDGKFLGKSDVYGRFILSNPKKSDQSWLRVEKEGYEKVEMKLGMEETSVFYFKSGTVDQLLSCAEEKLDEGELEQALEFCLRAEKIQGGRDDTAFLKKITLKKIKERKNEQN